MRARSIKLLSLLLALLIGLTGCGADSPREIHKIDWVTSPAYLAEEVPLPVPTGDLIGCCTDGEYMYILADEKLKDEVRSVLCRVSLTDGAVDILTEYEAPRSPDDALISRFGPITAPDGTLWVYETWFITNYDLPEDFDDTANRKSDYISGHDEFHHVRQLDPETGKQKKLVDLSEAVQTIDRETMYDISSFAVDGQGNIYFARNGGVAVLDGKGKHLFTLEAGMPAISISSGAGGRLALLPDGTVAALTTLPGGKRAVRTIDPSAKGWGADRWELTAGVDQICSGTGGFLFFFTRGRSLYAWEPDSKEERLLLTWSDIEIDGSIMCSAPLDEGKLAVLTLRYATALIEQNDWYKGNLRLSLLSPSSEDPDLGVVTLVYGTFGEDRRLRASIDAFNRAHGGECRIRIRNYAGDGVELFYDADKAAARDGAMKLLQAEVMSGNIPDIWDSSLPIDQYAQKGCLENLWPWIDGDAEIGGREALMSHVLDCMSVDGALYKLSDVFSIQTAVARSDIVGDRTGWTIDEALEYFASMPEGSSFSTFFSPTGGASALLGRFFFQSSASRWIDWSTGTCSFDSEAFKALMELCARIDASCTKHEGETGDDALATAAFMEGRQLMKIVSLNRPGDFLYNEALCGGPEHIMDYEAYLNENNIFGSSVDWDGTPRNEDAVILNQPLAALETAHHIGTLYGETPVTADAVYGAVEGSGCAAFVGLPCQTGSGSYFYFPRFVGMSASCENKEAAWSYIRLFLLESSFDQTLGAGSYGYLGFPVNKAAFDKYMAPTWMEDGNGGYLLDADGSRIQRPGEMAIAVGSPAPVVLLDLALNEEQMDAFMELYNSIGPSQEASEDLVNIIIEQSQPYFAGDKSLDETADLIQRRVTLYVNENR